VALPATIVVVDLNGGHPNRGVTAICEAIAAQGGRSRVLDLRREGALDVDGASAVILTGGPGSPCSPEPWRRRLQAALPGVGTRLPVLGICLGFQVMARAWGWGLGMLPSPRFGLYALPQGTRDGGWLRPLPRGATVFEQRSWAVWRRPQARGLPLATSAAGDVVAARFGPLAAGVIFHPEAAPGPVAQWFSTDAAAHARAVRLHGAQAAAGHAQRAAALATVHDSLLPGYVRWALDRSATCS